MQWVSGKLSGLSYQNFDGSDPVTIVPKRPYPQAYGCNSVSRGGGGREVERARKREKEKKKKEKERKKLTKLTIPRQWPAIAPVLTKIGTGLIVKIAERYNNETMWKAKVPSLRGPPLKQSTWVARGEEKDTSKKSKSCGESNICSRAEAGCGDEPPFAGIEISNEFKYVCCGSTVLSRLAFFTGRETHYLSPHHTSLHPPYSRFLHPKHPRLRPSLCKLLMFLYPLQCRLLSSCDSPLPPPAPRQDRRPLRPCRLC